MSRNYHNIFLEYPNLFSGVLLFLGCVIYPLGWSSDEVQRICGLSSGQFNAGSCNVRWAYILAIIGIVDVIVLAILAFVLAGRTAHRPYFAGRKGSVGTKCKSNDFPVSLITT